MTAEQWSQEKIEAFADHVSESSLHNRDQAIAWRKWALASCLSVNGGAAIAVMNLSSIDENSRLWAVIWFAAGIVFSILYGFVSAYQMAGWSGYFFKSSWAIRQRLFGQAGPEELNLEQFDKLLKRDKRVQLLQYAALPLFLVGLGVAVEGLL